MPNLLGALMPLTGDNLTFGNDYRQLACGPLFAARACTARHVHARPSLAALTWRAVPAGDGLACGGHDQELGRGRARGRAGGGEGVGGGAGVLEALASEEELDLPLVHGKVEEARGRLVTRRGCGCGCG